MTSTLNINHLPKPILPTHPLRKDTYDGHSDNFTPIVIDNGATTLRWGWGTEDESWLPYQGPNCIAKLKERRTNKPLLLFGEAIELESGARAQAKSPWEGDVLLNFDAMENVLDYVFIQLGIDHPDIDNPVVMTERLCTPLHSRMLTSELIFELYSCTGLTYCIDAIMSFYENSCKYPLWREYNTECSFRSDGLVLSFNTASTSVIPVLNGKGILSHAKRIPWGSSQASDYLLRLIQLKYPNFPTRVTTVQTNWMLQNLCEISTDYPALLRQLKDPLKLRASEQVIQFPFALPVVEEKTEEELARITEKRREQGRKLQEMAAKTRMEKLVQKENDLQYLLALKEGKARDSKREWANKLQNEGFDSDSALNDMIKKLENDVKKARKKEAGDGDDQPVEEPTFNLVDVPDADLDEEGLKEKRRQKLLKAGFESRARARKEKEREREEKQREEKREEEEREMDLNGWARKLRQEQEVLMTRIKDRSKRKAALSDRKSAAAQARMKSIANLASDDRVPKKKRKGGGEDMFGADDADWAIYRKINTAAPSSDEEDDLAQLATVEQKLLAYDPTFTPQHTHASIATKRSALLSAFRPTYEEGDVEGHARIHLSTERWRVCETYFAPSMAGVDSAGLGEVIQNVLARFTEEEKGRLVKNVFLTGAPSQLPGLVPRLQATLRPILPPEMSFEIVKARDPVLDAYNGMARFSRTTDLNKTWMSRDEYYEHGPERIRRWWGSNWDNALPPKSDR